MGQRKLRILFVNKVAPHLGGGAELRLWEVGKRLTARGHTVYVICARTQSGLPASETVDGMEVHYVRTVPDWLFSWNRGGFILSRILFYLVSPFFVNRFLRQSVVDIVRDDMSPFPGLGGLAVTGLAVPSVVTVYELFGSLRNWWQFYGPLGIGGYGAEILLKRGRLKYKKVIAGGKLLQSYLAPYLGERVTWIPIGVDVERFRPRVREDSGADRKLRILNVGRLVEHKGQVYLLRAFKRLVDQGADVELQIVGYGPLENRLRQYAKDLGITQRVQIGRVSEEQKLAIYQWADIFVLASLHEGGEPPIVVREAMASGLPIVATSIPVVRVVLNGDNALLVEPANEKSLYEGMVRIVRDKDLRAVLGKKARETIEQMPDWNQIAEQELQLYVEVAAKH